jgi:hypothetical protein
MLALGTRRRLFIAAGVAGLAVAGGITVAIASDHQGSPDVELNALQDMTDLYAFPAATPGRIAIVLNSRAFLTPTQSQNASFDKNLVYQIKVDNTGDAIEDKVFQVVFTGTGADQQVEVRGPIAPPVRGAMNNEVANTLAAVLLPDMLIVQADKATATAGWLSWALANGYGGRKLTDDVLDAAASAVFGSLLDPNNVSVGLTTDNVANDSQFQATFPYLAVPN